MSVQVLGEPGQEIERLSIKQRLKGGIWSVLRKSHMDVSTQGTKRLLLSKLCLEPFILILTKDTCDIITTCSHKQP